LPGNRQTKPTVAHQNLRRSANADQPTGLNFPPPCEPNDQAQNDPKLVSKPRWRLLSKADALPKRSTKSGLLPLKHFALRKASKRLHHESQPAFWKRTKTQTLKNGLSSGPTNAWFSRAGAVVRSLNRS
jgi:hypothetical protein